MALPLRRASMPEVCGLRPFVISASNFALAKADANHDGKVSFTEYAAHRLKMFRAGFDLLDTNEGRHAFTRRICRRLEPVPVHGAAARCRAVPGTRRSGDGKVAWTEFLA